MSIQKYKGMEVVKHLFGKELNSTLNGTYMSEVYHTICKSQH